MSKSNSKKTPKLDSRQTTELLRHAEKMIETFLEGLVPPQLGEEDYGCTFFNHHTVRFTKSFLKAQADFTRLAAKMLKAKAAHEPTIRTLGQKAAQRYVIMLAGNNGIDENGKGLHAEAQSLVDTVLEEISKVYIHIEANFLVSHDRFRGIIDLGRVRSMSVKDAGANTPLTDFPKILLKPRRYGKDVLFPKSGPTIIGMPTMVWVVEVPATKENVAEEAKWLIDVAISFMRLSSQHWSGRYPNVGQVEPHPILPPRLGTPHVTFHGGMYYAGGGKLPPVYDINKKVARDLRTLDCQQRAAILFDPPTQSLAMRVAQGLGWLTRGRQVSDRAERLLSFFTALEALLTSSDKSDPVTQTISRYVSVIYTQKLADRVVIFNIVKALYGLRSAVVHAGKREVLWQDVNNLQTIVETVYFVVLKRCDLTMSQERFAQSLSEASHGLSWEFAKPTSRARKNKQTRQ
ncbi:HEPN domain-containing protein [Rhizobium laguerreae]|uniref:HEPN domain-containing protein n=1 Tax=Rhizobium laguerreae TaxID=1076926 RepID=UPI0014428F87|nr:HEPN domain-containing protein [Rhizobium laguerreae]NKM36336.1 hypothetical protein [Rhizobium laguerreae]